MSSGRRCQSDTGVWDVARYERRKLAGELAEQLNWITLSPFATSRDEVPKTTGREVEGR